jgi:hypothetical protein
MVLSGETDHITKILVECECGCESIELSKYRWSDESDDYYIEIMASAFYSEQEGFFHKLSNRIKFAWFILTKGQHRLMEIILKKEDIEALKKALKKF